jgi:transcription elongation factor Elf1
MQFACPHCQQPLEADDSFAGAAVDCPLCGQSFVIGAPPPAVELEPAQEPTLSKSVEESPAAPEPEPMPPPPPAPQKATPNFRVVSKAKLVPSVSGDIEGKASDSHDDVSGTTVECPHCFTACVIAESAMGQYVDCPSCGKRFRSQVLLPTEASSGRGMPSARLSMAVPLVTQSILLLLIVLATILFGCDVNVPFYRPASSTYSNSNPGRHMVYYSLPSDMKKIMCCRDDINDAQRKYRALNGGNPLDWPRMLGAKYQERHNRELLEKEIVRVAGQVVSGMPTGYEEREMLMRYLGSKAKFIGVNTDASADFKSRRDAAIVSIKQSLGMNDAGAGGHAHHGTQVFLLLFSVFAILNAVFATILHYKCWAALPAKFARLTPGKAAGYLFIPFYRLYWAFPSIGGLGSDCVAFAKDKALYGFNRLRTFGLTLAILACAGGGIWILACCFVFLDGMLEPGVLLGLWATGGFPVIGLLLSIAKFVIWLFFYRGTTRLLDETMTAEASARQGE